MINSLDDFINVSKSFSMSVEKIETKEKGRLEFISKFPLTSIQTLKVDDYCLGTSEESFCYWLEFKEILFGIGGGNASKFGIYKTQDVGDKGTLLPTLQKKNDGIFNPNAT